MNLNDLLKIETEADRVSALYEIFNEDIRLTHSKAARVEFLTTVRFIEKYLKPRCKVLDLGAGTGEYSLYLANKGCEVTAIELASKNIEVFQTKIAPEMKIQLIHGNAIDLSQFKDNSFDIVLVFGPLYHLERESDRNRCIKEAMRVCKTCGILLFAFISNDMVFLTELVNQPDYFGNGHYNKETFQVDNFPFVFFTVEQATNMLKNAGVNVTSIVASDGVSELLAHQINRMDELNYQQYLRYHWYCCEKPEMLGRSNHLLFIGTK